MWHSRQTKAGLVDIALLVGACAGTVGAQQVQVSSANRTISINMT